MGARIAVWTSLGLIVFAGHLLAQSAQYTAPGSLTGGSAIPTEESFERKIEEAPWKLGLLRLQPWLGLRDAQLVDTLLTGEGETDFTATLGAGLRAYVKSGPKVVWAAHALPEYTWWADDDSRSRFNGRYGAGLFTYFNRLRFELSGRRDESQGFFSSELQELASIRRDLLRAAVEVEIAPRLELYVGTGLEDFDNREDEIELFGRLDREERISWAGLRYRFPGDRWTIGAGYEDTETDFADGARSLDTTGDAETFELGYVGARFGARLDLAARTLEPEPGSLFAGLDETTGSLAAVWDLSSRSSLLTYARRTFSFSLVAGTSHYLSDRYGARLAFAPGRRLGIALYAEAGEDEYEETLGAILTNRVDDVTAFGATLSFPLTRYLDLALVGSVTDYDSNLDAFDRDVSTIGLRVELGTPLREAIGRFTERLRLGEPGEDW